MRSLRPLSDQERQELEACLKRAKDAAEWRRIFAILSYDEGQSIEELAHLTRLSPWTIEEYLKEYSAHKKTKNDPSGGGSSKLTKEETCKLEKHLSETTYLKVKDIVGYVEKTFNKEYSRSGMTKWLIEHRFAFKRPEKVPGKLDPSKQQEFIKEYESLKNRLGQHDKLYFLDAIHPEYQSQAVCGWIKKGERKTLQTTGKQKRLHLIGALNLKEMDVVVAEYETIDGDAITHFFNDLEGGNREGEMHIILDNAAAHKNRKVLDYLKSSRIRLHYLPPYSPNLNPIERLWKLFREITLYNRYFSTCRDFFAAVRGFFTDTINQIKPLLKQRINDNFQIISLNPIKLH
ncbi:MAG: IS630 family transposase [Verrucomicrobia bacterium]|nr:IS630 family transposase [Verrucomicrobiota bacterium]